MNSWGPYRLATLLVAVVALVVGLAIMPAQAHCPHRGSTTHRHCDGVGGDPTPQDCALEFQGRFDDRMTDRVGSERLLLPSGDPDPDPGDLYINDVRKVQFTSGTLQTQGMLRFDTNASAKVEKPRDDRKVWLDFRGASVTLQNAIAEAGFDFALKGIDLRFDFTDDLGLNVCELIPVGGAGYDPGDERGHVVLNIVFLTGDGEDYALSYGCRANPGDVPDDLNASKALVTRTSDSTWTIEGVNACLRDGPGAYYPRIDLNPDSPPSGAQDGFDPATDQIQMPFKIWLTDLNALP